MTEIRLYNTATRTKEDFVPLDPKNVRMYVCGPTVYDRAHLGNARPVLVFDVLFRLLRHVYGEDHVTYVRNFTDVDDKINATALARKEAGAAGSLEELIAERADETINWYLEDMRALGALDPNEMPRATQYIQQMIDLSAQLIKDGYAYARDGHVLFRVRKYAQYGKLSGRSVDDMIAGARVEVAPYKEDPMDFVLWKPSDDALPGWDSPWGRGRPGWHIECSAMAHALLGAEFDIHGGGNDLTFPHHENEIAQSKCAGHGFARYWMHNEMLQVEGKKMSKSLGNFFTVRDLLDQGVPGEVIRFVMLETHYRKPMDWTSTKRQFAEDTLHYWMKTTIELEPTSVDRFEPDARIVEALSDDLNTHLALSYLRALHHQPQKLLDNARWLGFLSDDARTDWNALNSLEGYSFSFVGEPTPEQVSVLSDFREAYFKEYLTARKTKDFASVDKLRQTANELGLKLKVTVNQTDIDVTRRLNEDEFSQLRDLTEALK